MAIRRTGGSAGICPVCRLNPPLNRDRTPAPGACRQDASPAVAFPELSFTGMEQIMSIGNTAQRADAISKLLTPEHDPDMVEAINAAVEKRRQRGDIPPNARYALANCWGNFIGLNLDFVSSLGDAQGMLGIYSRGVRGWTYIVL